MEININNANPGDAEDIQKLYYETYIDTYVNNEYGVTLGKLQSRYKDMLSEKSIAWLRSFIKSGIPQNHRYLVAKVDDKVVGVSYLEKESDHNRLQGLYIKPEYQGRGIGKMLWEEAKKFFDFKNVTILEVVEYTPKAINFYKKLGFIDTGKRYLEENVSAEKIRLPMMEMSLLPIK